MARLTRESVSNKHKRRRSGPGPRFDCTNAMQTPPVIVRIDVASEIMPKSPIGVDLLTATVKLSGTKFAYKRVARHGAAAHEPRLTFPHPSCRLNLYPKLAVCDHGK